MNICMYTHRGQFKGTDKVEIVPGFFQGASWGEGSVFFEEEVFFYFLPAIYKHVPWFDYYGITVIERARWERISDELRFLSCILRHAETEAELLNEDRQIMNVPEASFLKTFSSSKERLATVADELVAWAAVHLQSKGCVTVRGL